MYVVIYVLYKSGIVRQTYKSENELQLELHEKTGTTHRKGEQKYVRNSGEERKKERKKKNQNPRSDRWMDELDI